MPRPRHYERNLLKRNGLHKKGGNSQEQNPKNVDMDIVQKLIDWKKSMNINFPQYRCTLHPNPDSPMCKLCGIREECNSHKAEREYIHNNQGFLKKRRKKKS